LGSIFPSLSFYAKFIAIVFKASKKAKLGKFSTAEWCHSSYKVLQALEKKGITFEITGIEQVENLEGPAVIIGNHMSMLETVILPIILLPVKEITFIVKQSLLDYPVFKHVMRSCDPIAVTRTNPRQDLTAVLEGGMERLKKGISIVVFPQTTRTLIFDEKRFTTIGVKLAQRAEVPIVPLALKTDAWGNGRRLKDFGKIDASKNVKFSFGAPLKVKRKGSDEHQAIIELISNKLKEWKD